MVLGWPDLVEKAWFELFLGTFYIADKPVSQRIRALAAPKLIVIKLTVLFMDSCTYR
jgi:hypothetical protein